MKTDIAIPCANLLDILHSSVDSRTHELENPQILFAFITFKTKSLTGNQSLRKQGALELSIYNTDQSDTRFSNFVEVFYYFNIKPIPSYTGFYLTYPLSSIPSFVGIFKISFPKCQILEFLPWYLLLCPFYFPIPIGNSFSGNSYLFTSWATSSNLMPSNNTEDSY